MKVLFVGDVNSFLIRNLAIALKSKMASIEIDILSTQEPFEQYSAFDQVFSVKSAGILSRTTFIKSVYFTFALRKKSKDMWGNYDIVHILYASSIYNFIWESLTKKGRKIVLTIFGSDYYRVSERMRAMIGKQLRYCDKISFSNQYTLADVKQFYKLDSEKLVICRFGLIILDEIDAVQEEEKAEFLKNYNIPDKKKIIACGYNASANQNIGKIVDALITDEYLSEKVHITFQFHGIRTPEINNALLRLTHNNFTYTVLDERLPDHVLAIYRSIVHIMVQLQNTDQFSGAMQEHLYAGSLVITGGWLRYDLLEECGADMIRISEIEELPEVLNLNLDRVANREKNRSIIGSVSKWENVLVDWIKLYQ